MAAVGVSFKAGESMMEQFTGKPGAVLNTAAGGAAAGLVMGFRSGSIPVMAATAAGCAFGCTVVALK